MTTGMVIYCYISGIYNYIWLHIFIISDNYIWSYMAIYIWLCMIIYRSCMGCVRKSHPSALPVTLSHFCISLQRSGCTRVRFPNAAMVMYSHRQNSCMICIKIFTWVVITPVRKSPCFTVQSQFYEQYRNIFMNNSFLIYSQLVQKSTK